ncbi:SDR family NAD(P)-dependent oxidoreductase [Microbacterium hominis]|uniref:SDR family oxidoreductase n=1 Tax=Microbacterium hominis TaxID=162426 RepID=A0A7D4Q2I6_9MICO|nr:SDR family NAD(P)-dependent oxidoreductase [Microbacterium hominis]QKJ20392.1 SDR family oxidoreductase [Microbacterium hominis]
MRLPGLDGRVIVVTGAARGQGLAEALLLAQCGAQVVATDIVDAAPTAFADTTIEYRRLNVADESAWARLAGELRERLGDERLRGLVNNAGITHRARLGAVERADWDRVLAVNVTGAMLGIQALTPLMGDGSSIVNVGSSAALNGHYPVAYTTSKWALRGLTHVAATELGPRGIRVNIIHPGFIETEMTASAGPAMREAQLAATPLERTGHADEVASGVAFLLSDAATYVSGAEIPIDGGSTSSAGAKIMADRIARAASPVER